MQIVIPYIDFNGPELRYCLRGISKFIDNPDVTIIGGKPNWYKGNHIYFKDDLQNQFRSRNIYDKIMLATSDFLFFNDDHFLLEPFDPDTYYCSGTMETELARRPSTSYQRTLQNTYKAFGNIKNFDTHCPIFYKREILEKIKVDWTKPHGYCIKSVYAHLAGIEGTEYEDLKIRHPASYEALKNQIKGRKWFSIDDIMDKAMVKVLEEIYPEKSCYED